MSHLASHFALGVDRFWEYTGGELRTLGSPWGLVRSGSRRLLRVRGRERLQRCRK